MWKDSLSAFSRSSFDPTVPLKVTFVGESGIDTGGPRREYFELLMRSLVADSGLFVGPAEKKSFSHNVQLLHQRQYYTTGQMVGCCLVQGGNGICCLSPTTYLYMAQATCVPTVEDIPEYDTRQKADEVSRYC